MSEATATWGRNIVVDGTVDLPEVTAEDILDIESGKYEVLTVVRDYRASDPEWPLRVRFGYYVTERRPDGISTQVAKCETRFSHAECVEMMLCVHACQYPDPFQGAVTDALKRRHQRTIRESSNE